MDNICHTLVGAALGEAGLKHRTRHGNLTLMIAANLPDIDVLVFATNTLPVSFRRGWTHGVLAQALLPLALTAVVVALSRRRGHPAGERTMGDPPVRVLWLLALSYLGLSSHVFLDYLNNYGVRLLAPVDWRWFYGDALFIIDIWLWVMVGAGVWLSRRMSRPAPARGALLFAACYIVAMLVAAGAARASVFEAWRSLRGTAPRAVMVGPLPVTPFQRQVIVDAGDHYESGRFSWSRGSMALSAVTVAKNGAAPEVARARESTAVRSFLVWSRFPYWELTAADDGTTVTVKDMRFGDRFSASVIVPRSD
jgi:inner membrane protein